LADFNDRGSCGGVSSFKTNRETFMVVLQADLKKVQNGASVSKVYLMQPAQSQNE